LQSGNQIAFDDPEVFIDDIYQTMANMTDQLRDMMAHVMYFKEEIMAKQDEQADIIIQ
jgi:hypothetical protein